MNTNSLITYFYNSIDRTTDAELIRTYKQKSGSLAETTFHQLFPHLKHQTKYKSFRFDFTSEYIIYEIKDYMYSSSGTADEKLLYSLFKYTPCLENGYKNIIVVLCAKMEQIYINKYEPLFVSTGLIQQLTQNGVYIAFMSDLICEFYFNNQNSSSMSFIKWVGGKSKLISHILPHIKERLGGRYIEPFAGGGSILFELLSNTSMKYVVSDINKQLITCYKTIQTHHVELIQCLNVLKSLYLSLSEQEREKLYYLLRDSYNLIINEPDQSIQLNYSSDLIIDHELINDYNDYLGFDVELIISTLFIFLNKTCFRGLYRVNKSNQFNVPFGHYKSISFDNIERFNELLQHNVEFYNLSYDELLNTIKPTPDDIVYFDPPYYKTFSDYDSQEFDHDKFAHTLITLAKQHVKVVFSNSQAFIEHYEHIKQYYNIETITINDKINSKSPNAQRVEIVGYNK